MSFVSARIGYRYSKTKISSSFIALINFFSVLGLCLGVAALIVVLSVMNGLEDQLKQRILGVVPHIVITQPLLNPVINQLKPELQDSIIATMPFIERQALVQSAQDLSGVSLQGVEPDTMQHYTK